MASDKLNIGCGSNLIEGWRNIDPYAKGPRVEKMFVHQIESGCAGHILLQHVLEHINFHEQPGFVKELFRILKPGGTVHIVAPDFDVAVKMYYESGMKIEALYRVIPAIFGSGGSGPMMHYSPVTQARLRDLLEYAGFAEIKINEPATASPLEVQAFGKKTENTQHPSRGAPCDTTLNIQ